MNSPRRTTRDLAAIFVGGAVGTMLRAGLGTLGSAWPTLAVNLVGAFALGLLLESLASLGMDDGLRRTLRLALGTGLLGGFTTYSALALETWTLGWMGPAYAIATVVLGLVAAWLGISVARRAVAR